MTDPRELNSGDEVLFACEGLSDVLFEVSDTQVKDIGLTEVFAVTLVSDSEEAWSLTGTMSSDMATLNELDGGREYDPLFEEIHVR